MATELSKTYEPSAVETEAYRVWLTEGCFHAEPANPGNPYAIVIPPPNVTAALHLGHALNNTIQDILTRYHRMLGDNACWLPGTDHAGIATQTIVDKRLQAEGKPALKDYKRMEADGGRPGEPSGREQFLQKVQAWKDEYEKKITDQLKAMGCSCDWERQAFTMDEPRAKAVREAFYRLFRDGLIYRGKRLVNWDPVSQTALADDEVEMEDVDGQFYYLRYPLVPVGSAPRTETAPDAESVRDADPTHITVATTRPETMLGDTAVAINPKDPRAAALRGRFIRLPIVNRVIPIVEDDYVVLSVAHGGDPADSKAQMATGFLKVTPAHDPNDYEIGRRHNLPMINVMAPDAGISDKHGWTDIGDAGFLLGKSREEARRLVVKWFREQGLLEDMKPYKHAVGHSYRSHVPIEPYLSDQWYCQVTDDRLAGAALRAMAAEQRDNRDAASNDDTSTSRDRKGAGPASIAQPTFESPRVAARSDESVTCLAYFITFSGYGTWLHGTDRGSVDREHNVLGTPILMGDEQLERDEFKKLGGSPATFDAPQREVIQRTILEVCSHRNWTLHVVHARTNHVHAVVTSNVPPEKAMNDFKAYATRRLREAGLIADDTRVWTRHGSTRYLNDKESLYAAIEYVHDQQGPGLEPGPLAGSRLGTSTSEPSDAEFDSNTLSPSMDSAGTESPLPYGRGSSASAPSSARLRFFPPRYAKTFQLWHENIRDWCISRQLWWGHRIPVWGFTNDDAVDSKTDEQLSSLIEQLIRLKNDGRVAIIHAERKNDLAPIDLQHSFVCVREEDDRPAIELLSQLGFTQDPDVLDTWFSSGLWPISTLNWPAESEISNPKSALNTWNPSNVLTTAREIITLWVSRMVMFNLYLRDCLPFTDVFIHAMIQDGEGQKMSKTLGNGVDPLDIIESHGADAMRYTLAAMTTHTQDLRMPVDMVCPHTGETFKPKMTTISGGFVVAEPIQVSPKDPSKKMVSTYGYTSGKARPTADMPLAKNTSSKFDLGRNFCNKIWNAARYALGSLEAVGSAPRTGAEGDDAVRSADPASCTRAEAVDESKWSMVDRWIVSRFNRTVAECNQAIADYRFDVYARSLYDFFWRDLCDWYLEAIKPAMKDPARAPQTANILASLLDGSLRLMHPAIPFITETIWWKLNEVRPKRGLPGRIDCPPSARLVTARWPTVGDASEAAEHIFPKVQELITGIRQIRNERQVNPKQVITVSINASAERARSIEMNREVVEGLALCTLREVGPDVQAAANAARLLCAGCEIYAEGLVDEAAEKQRTDKLRQQLLQQKAGMEGRLSNEQYLAKAPAKLVEQTRAQLAAVIAELERLG